MVVGRHRPPDHCSERRTASQAAWGGAGLPSEAFSLGVITSLVAVWLTPSVLASSTGGAVEAHVESVLVMVSHEAPLFPRAINCFERPHLEGLIFWLPNTATCHRGSTAPILMGVILVF
jgi:hypothetical protein